MISATGHNLVFLLSTPRAGSTLLSVLLNELPGILCPPEPWFLLRLLALNGPGNPNARHNDDIAASGSRRFLGDPISPAALRAFAVCIYNEKLSATGRTVFVDKTPRYFHILPELEKLFPEARFIWLRRNPLDVAASYKSTWNLSPGELFHPPARCETLDFVLGLDAYQRFFSVPASNRLTLRYEDLVLQPADKFAQLGTFLDIPSAQLPHNGQLSPAVLAMFKDAVVGDPKVLATRSIHASSIDRWRTQLTPDESRLVMDTLGTTIFEEMGYASVVAEIKRLGWAPSSAQLAAERRAALVREQRTTTAEIERLNTLVQEQTVALEANAREKARLAEDVASARVEVARAHASAQGHIDQLLAQIKHLASVIDEQNRYIAFLKGEVEKLQSGASG